MKDVSGGCGAMFDITVESSAFKVIPVHHQARLFYYPCLFPFPLLLPLLLLLYHCLCLCVLHLHVHLQGQSLVKQHKVVHELLRAEIKEMHGLTLKTKATKE